MWRWNFDTLNCAFEICADGLLPFLPAFVVVRPEIDRIAFWHQFGDEFPIGSTVRDNYSVSFARLVHVIESVPCGLKTLDAAARHNFAEYERAHFCALWVVAPRAGFQPIMEDYKIASAIVYRKSDAAVVQPHKSSLFQPGTELY